MGATRRGTYAAHTKTLSLTAVVVPTFVPAALPAVDVDLMAGADDLFDERFTGGKTLELGSMEAEPDVPEDGLSNTAVAARLRWTPRFADFGLMARGAR